MSTESALNSLSSLAAIGILVVLWWKCYPSMRVEEFRQAVFRLRASLFDSAARGEIAFDDELYQVLRSTMNGMLKDADNITFLDIVHSEILAKRFSVPNQFADVLKRASQDLTPEKNAVYAPFLKKIPDLLVLLIIRRSIVLFAFFEVFKLCARFGTTFRQFNLMTIRKVEKAAQQTEYQAYQIGRRQVPC